MQYTFLKCSTRAQRHNVYFHAPKCSFNLDPIWDQKCNFGPLEPTMDIILL